jgi:hypothetical protein
MNSVPTRPSRRRRGQQGSIRTVSSECSRCNRTEPDPWADAASVRPFSSMAMERGRVRPLRGHARRGSHSPRRHGTACGLGAGSQRVLPSVAGTAGEPIHLCHSADQYRRSASRSSSRNSARRVASGPSRFSGRATMVRCLYAACAEAVVPSGQRAGATLSRIAVMDPPIGAVRREPIAGRPARSRRVTNAAAALTAAGVW